MVRQTVGRYEVIRELGRGGIAVVFLAQDSAFSRQVAVKVLPPPSAFDTFLLVRFQREAKIMAALEHSCIVPVYDYGEEGDQPFIVMRYMPGGSLADRIAAKPMLLSEIVPIVGRLAEALDEAHRQDIIHRDVKPSNVMFDADGHAYLSDFGIGTMLQGSIALSGSRVAGTPAYMSPEQAVGEGGADHRSDIYSLGLILYEMLAGHHPYEADAATSPIWLMRQHVTGPVPQLAAEDLVRLALPPECNAILAHALAKKPADRHRTAGAMAEDVRALSAMTPSDVSRPTAPIVEAAPRTEPAPSPPIHSAPPASLQPMHPTLRLSQWLWPRSAGRIATLGALAGLAVFLSLALGSEPTATRISTRPTTSIATAAPSNTAAPTPTEELATVAVVAPSRTQASSPTPTSSVAPTATASPPADTPTSTVSPTVTRRPITRVPPTSTLPPPTPTPLLQPTSPPQPPPDTAPAPPPATEPAEPPTLTPPPPP